MDKKFLAMIVMTAFNFAGFAYVASQAMDDEESEPVPEYVCAYGSTGGMCLDEDGSEGEGEGEGEGEDESASLDEDGEDDEDPVDDEDQMARRYQAVTNGRRALACFP